MLRVMTLPVLAAALLWGAPDTAAAKGKSQKVVTGVVNLNQANTAQLEMLPGVGVKTANAIITYRQKVKFSRPEDLVKVKGFGKKKFEKLRPHLAVTGPTTLAVRTVQAPPPAQARPAPAKR